MRTTFIALSILLNPVTISSNIRNSTPATTAVPFTAIVSNSSDDVTSAISVDFAYPAETHIMCESIIESTKIEESSEIVTVKGAFRMEENIRLHTGAGTYQMCLLMVLMLLAA